MSGERLGSEQAQFSSAVIGQNKQAAAGFEPANNGFANRRLGPLGYAATQSRHQFILNSAFLQQKMLLHTRRTPETDAKSPIHHTGLQEEPMDYASRTQQDSPVSRAAPCPAVFCACAGSAFEEAQNLLFYVFGPQTKLLFHRLVGAGFAEDVPHAYPLDLHGVLFRNDLGDG